MSTVMCTHISRNINLRNQIIKDKVDGTFAHYHHFVLGSVTVRSSHTQRLL